MRGSWEGKGQPVVLLHGQPGSGHDWDLVKGRLDGLQVLAPDRPGYDGAPALDFAGNAGQLSEILRDSGVTRAVVVGHSWGGGVALQLALDHPGQVAGLCLLGSIGSPLSFTNSDRLVERLGLTTCAAVATCVSAVLAPKIFAAATGSELSAAQRKELRRRGRAWLRRGAVTAIAAEQKFMLQGADHLAARLGEVTAPALVLSGDRDRTVSPAAAADLARALPRAALRLVPGGHLLPHEAPDRVAEAVRQVVAEAEW